MFLKTLMVFLELVCIGHLYVFLSWRQTTWSILNIVKKPFFLTFSHQSKFLFVDDANFSFNSELREFQIKTKGA